MTAPRSYVCLCGHPIGGHSLYRDQLSPGTPYHWGRCLVDGCECPAAINETGSIAETPQPASKPGPEWQQHARAQILDALLRSLEAARRRREPWLDWVDKRRRGEHDHAALRADGTPAACPVAGCDAKRDDRL